jgi:hypothetical protein
MDMVEGCFIAILEDEAFWCHGELQQNPGQQKDAADRYRNRLDDIIKEIDPEGVASRRRDLQRCRGEYITPGPNFVWSIDGYCKLDVFGFQIYGAIDAYSRYVVWAYVGVSAHTGISCLRQFLDVVAESHTLPRFIRSDHGGETTLLAAAHHVLRRAEQPDVEFSDCYLYGTSTSNQRIVSVAGW